LLLPVELPSALLPGDVEITACFASALLPANC
jgi:hypothetical protein